jgi:hypothetical protein
MQFVFLGLRIVLDLTALCLAWKLLRHGKGIDSILEWEDTNVIGDVLRGRLLVGTKSSPDSVKLKLSHTTEKSDNNTAVAECTVDTRQIDGRSVAEFAIPIPGYCPPTAENVTWKLQFHDGKRWSWALELPLARAPTEAFQW